MTKGKGTKGQTTIYKKTTQKSKNRAPLNPGVNSGTPEGISVILYLCITNLR